MPFVWLLWYFKMPVLEFGKKREGKIKK